MRDLAHRGQGAIFVLCLAGSSAQCDGALCEGAAATEYRKCTSDCKYNCTAASFAACDVQMKVGDFGTRAVPAKDAYSLACDKTTQCSSLKAEIWTDAQCCGKTSADRKAKCGVAGLPKDACTKNCAPRVLYFWSECEETVGKNDSVAQEAGQEANKMCRQALLTEGARLLYAEFSSTYLPNAAWVLAMVPFCFCLVFVFFGRHLTSIFRCLIGGIACWIPVAWPLLSPIIAKCSFGVQGDDLDAGCEKDWFGSSMSAMFILQFAFSIVVFFMAAFTVRALQNFGHAIQGFALGFVLCAWTLDAMLGTVSSVGGVDRDELGWLDFSVLIFFGVIFSILTVLLPDFMNLLGSAAIGTYLCSQIICTIGYFKNWFWSFPLSIVAAALGLAGCTDDGWCWFFLVCCILLCLAGIITQVWTKRTEFKVYTRKDSVGCVGSVLFHLHQGMSVLLDMEDSMKVHAEMHSAEEMAELADHYSASWVKAATFTSDMCIIVIGVSLLVNAIQLVVEGVSDQGAQVMTAYLGLTAVIAIFFTFYEMSIHNNVTENERIRKFDCYIWGIFALIPLAVSGFFICISLGSTSDPLGLHDDFGVDLMRDNPDWGDTWELKHQRTVFMRHMQVAAIAYLMLTFACALTAGYVAKNLGGWLYLARKLVKLVAFILLVVGSILAYLGFGIAATAEAQDMKGVDLYNVLGGVGVGMALTGLMGLIASICIVRRVKDAAKGPMAGQSDEPDDQDDQETGGGGMAFGDMPSDTPPARGGDKEFCRTTVMRVFCFCLLVLLLANIYVFIRASLWASEVPEMSDDSFREIQNHRYILCLSRDGNAIPGDADECTNSTRTEFVKDVQSSYQLLMAAGVTSSAYLFVGLIGALYVSMQSRDTLNQAEALVAKHAKAYLDNFTAQQLRDSAARRKKRLGKNRRGEGAQALERIRDEQELKQKRRKKRKKVKKVKKKKGGDADESGNPLASTDATFEVEGGSEVSITGCDFCHLSSTTVSILVWSVLFYQVLFFSMRR